ncbi:hypothetical protein BOTNAR_0426g00100 [Botryotinia narcissicola]|uniref:Uncharacterized protein n=1 Tax=Botryotinia narcissicola TaxID=278944 RepID=A0A4Z1HL34_9HELO|nr:hypothetical protein BOTNAR_0426g00100 [Botryotinia narcissicola]
MSDGFPPSPTGKLNIVCDGIFANLNQIGSQKIIVDTDKSMKSGSGSALSAAAAVAAGGRA